MNITTIRDNLKRTIANKEEYLQVMSEKADIAVYPKNKAYAAVAEFLEININELKVILFDVEQCIAKDIEQSWRENPDRMGGQFTEDEINNSTKWQ